jgi:branched-chain amino acid transport system ATP-binding protein
MLSVENIHVFYGKIAAVKGLSLKVEKGQIVTLLGANGTGKTTVLNTISGFLRSSKGSITYNDQKISNLRSDKIVRLGLVQVSQNRDLFPALSVYDNLMLGGLLQKNSQLLSEALDRVYEYFPILKKRKSQDAGLLSGGEQQMLAIGRALMSSPEFILLDEPTTGLAPLIVKNITEIIKIINEQGITILWVEQNAITAISIADYLYILRDGRVVYEGVPGDLPENKKDFFREYYI